MTALDEQLRKSDGRTNGEAAPERTLHDAAQAMLSHGLALEEEREAAAMLRAMGVAAPTGADGVLLGQYLKALRGDTAAAKYVRDAALERETAEGDAPVSDMDLTQLSDEALYALAAEAES